MKMEQELNKIILRYKELEKSLLRQGRLPMKDTNIGFWSYANSNDIFELFKKIKLTRFNHFMDLGSGDGRVALIASLFTKSTGIEIDHELHMIANAIKSELKCKDVTLINDDFYNHNLSKHDIIFVNPDRPMYRGLETKLLNELKGQLIVYGPFFHPSSLNKVDDAYINGTYIGIYSK